MNINFSADQQAWQQRLGKEKRALKVHLCAYYGRKGAEELLAPKVPKLPQAAEVAKAEFDRLYGTPSKCRSLPALHTSLKAQEVPKAIEQVRIPTSQSLQSAKWSDGRRTAAKSGLLFFDNTQLQQAPPTASVRSGLSGISMSAALWQQVEAAVQEEVAKVIQPLREQLKQEEEARKKVEMELRAAHIPT